MDKEYVAITSLEMQELLQGLGFILDNDKTEQHHEEVYVRSLGVGNLVWVYSSISTFSGRSAGRGADAIRIVTYDDKSKRFKKYPRTYRTANWRKNLSDKIGAILADVLLVGTMLKGHMDKSDHFKGLDRVIATQQSATCCYCGDPEVNGLTDGGQPVCAQHEFTYVKNMNRLPDPLNIEVGFAVYEVI